MSAILCNTALSFPPSSPFIFSLSVLSLLSSSCHTLSPFLPTSTMASAFDVKGKIPEIEPKFTPASSKLADLPCIIGVELVVENVCAPILLEWAAMYPCPGGNWRAPFTSFKNGWARHSCAVALSSESNASIGSSQSANPWAVSGSHSYFSVNTSYNPHGFSLVMCLSSPSLYDANVCKRFLGSDMLNLTQTFILMCPNYLSCWKIHVNNDPQKQYVLESVLLARWYALNDPHLLNNRHQSEVQTSNLLLPFRKPCRLRTRYLLEGHNQHQEVPLNCDIVWFEYLPWNDESKI